MYFFVAFAVIVWFACFRLRRSWGAVGVCLGALAILVGVAYFHWKLNEWTNGRIFLPVMQVILYPYTMLVVGIGLYITVLPRPALAGACEYCRYDLAGLEDPLCPECGRPDERLVAASPRAIVLPPALPLLVPAT